MNTEPKQERWKPGDGHLLDPMGWRKPRMVWVDPMLFGPDVSDEHRDKVHAVMALCKQHAFIVPTAWTARMEEYLNGMEPDRRWGTWFDAQWALGKKNIRRAGALPLYRADAIPLPNVILGALASNQAELDERVPHLLRCPAARRCVVLDPLEGAVDLDLKTVDDWDGPGLNTRVEWVVIAGGKNPLDVAWVRSIVEQCKAAGVSVLVKRLGKQPCNGVFKQNPVRGTIDAPSKPLNRFRSRDGSDPSEWPSDIRIQQWPEVAK